MAARAVVMASGGDGANRVHELAAAALAEYRASRSRAAGRVRHDDGMNTNREAAPAGLRIARWYLAAVAALLLGIGAVTIVGHVAQAAAGTALVFSQEEMRVEGAIGPAPTAGEAPPAVPEAQASGSTQFVDLPSLALTLAAGAVAAAGAGALFRRTRFALPLGIAASAVAAGAGLIPAAIGLWAVDYYALVDLASVMPLLVMSAVLVTAAALTALAVWRSRRILAPA